jgi:radical SAM superfamily enzyme YgiQ (UPF0313 family)
MPVGVFGLLNLLISRGYEVKAINVGIEKFLDENYSLEDELNELDYKVLLVDLHWYEHSYGAIQVCELSKKLSPQIPTIVGGFTATIYSGEILKNFNCIDFALKGDSEKPLMMLADYLIKNTGSLEHIPNICYRENEHIIDKEPTSHCEDIGNLDFVSHDFLKNNEFLLYTTPLGLKKTCKSFWLCIARGCIYNCSYCCGSNLNLKRLFGRREVIVRPVHSIVNDIERLYDLGAEQIAPTHDFAMFGDKYFTTLFSSIRSRKIPIGLYLECFQLPSKDYISQITNTFDERFTSIEISPLAGDELVRKTNGKFFSNDSLCDFDHTYIFN